MQIVLLFNYQDFACRICFSVEMHTNWGEEVRVVGSRPELGSWDPQQGVPLRTIPVSLKAPQSPPADVPPAMCRRGSVLPMESVQQLPTLLSTPVPPRLHQRSAGMALSGASSSW